MAIILTSFELGLSSVNLKLHLFVVTKLLFCSMNQRNFKDVYFVASVKNILGMNPTVDKRSEAECINNNIEFIISLASGCFCK